MCICAVLTRSCTLSANDWLRYSVQNTPNATHYQCPFDQNHTAKTGVLKWQQWCQLYSSMVFILGELHNMNTSGIDFNTRFLQCNLTTVELTKYWIVKFFQIQITLELHHKLNSQIINTRIREKCTCNSNKCIIRWTVGCIRVQLKQGQRTNQNKNTSNFSNFDASGCWPSSLWSAHSGFPELSLIGSSQWPQPLRLGAEQEYDGEVMPSPRKRGSSPKHWLVNDGFIPNSARSSAVTSWHSSVKCTLHIRDQSVSLKLERVGSLHFLMEICEWWLQNSWNHSLTSLQRHTVWPWFRSMTVYQTSWSQNPEHNSR